MTEIPDPAEPVRAYQDQPRGLSEFKQNQIPFKSAATCKIHIKCSVGPKIENNIPLESLEHVQSSSTIISYILWVQFETIFKLESDLPLAY
jgi:hypothetical protein